MSRRNDFLEDCRRYWTQAIAEVAGPNPADSMSWSGIDHIEAALRPFMGLNRNHAHYPTGGGMDFHGVEKAREPGCLAFSVDDRAADIVKPRALTLEYFSSAPRESFLLLELDSLKPSGANKNPSPSSEEVMEYPEGKYLNQDVWERGYLKLDASGREVPLPASSRLVTRWFDGKILIVTKGSWWNGNSATYFGNHNKMTAAQIRATIEQALD